MQKNQADETGREGTLGQYGGLAMLQTEQKFKNKLSGDIGMAGLAQGKIKEEALQKNQADEISRHRVK